MALTFILVVRMCLCVAEGCLHSWVRLTGMYVCMDVLQRLWYHLHGEMELKWSNKTAFIW